MVRPRDEAARVRAADQWAGRQHRGLQYRSGNRTDTCVDGRAHRPRLLAHAAWISGTCVRHEHDAHVRRISSDRLSTVRLPPVEPLMATTQPKDPLQGPSPKQIAAAAAAALAIAALLLAAAVLPAEYGKDPLGTGKALGLLDLY